MSLEKIHANNRSAQNLTGALKALAKDVNPIIDAVIELQNIKPYKVYTALLTQSGTNAPTAVVLHNELNDVSFIYVGIGSYRIVSTSFVQHKTYIAIQQGSGNQGRVAIDLNLLELGGINDIYINTINTTFSSVDEILSSTPIEIRVYN